MEKLNEQEGVTFAFSTHAPRIIKLEDEKVVSDERK